MHIFRSLSEINCQDVVAFSDIIHPDLRYYSKVKYNYGLYFHFPLNSFLPPSTNNI